MADQMIIDQESPVASGLQRYEAGFLLSSEGAASDILTLIEGFGVKIIERREARSIPLAYEIEGHHSAHFGSIVFEAEGSQVLEIQKKLKIHDGVLRSLVIHVEVQKPRERQEKKERPEEVRQEKAEKLTAELSPEKRVLTNEALEEKLEEILK